MCHFISYTMEHCFNWGKEIREALVEDHFILLYCSPTPSASLVVVFLFCFVLFGETLVEEYFLESDSTAFCEL